MSAMIRGGSTGKVLLTRGPLFYQPERSRAAFSHSASKQCFKLCRRDFISSYLPVCRSSRVERTVKMWGNGGWRCITQSSIEILDRHKLAEYGGEEIEEAVRHYRWSVASGPILHQEGLERCFEAREGEYMLFTGTLSWLLVDIFCVFGRKVQGRLCYYPSREQWEPTRPWCKYQSWVKTGS